MVGRGLAGDAPRTEEEEAAQIATALHESLHSVRGAAAQPSAWSTPASESTAGVHFVASETEIFIAGQEPSAAPPVREPEAEEESASSSTGPAVSLSGYPLSPAQLAARQLVGKDRLERGRTCGYFALQKLEGHITWVPASPVLEWPSNQKRLFVLIRGKRGVDRRGLAAFSYGLFKGYVENYGKIDPWAIFHGFASQAEALEYWQAVFGNQPWPLLPGMP